MYLLSGTWTKGSKQGTCHRLQRQKHRAGSVPTYLTTFSAVPPTPVRLYRDISAPYTTGGRSSRPGSSHHPGCSLVSGVFLRVLGLSAPKEFSLECGTLFGPLPANPWACRHRNAYIETSVSRYVNVKSSIDPPSPCSPGKTQPFFPQQGPRTFKVWVPRVEKEVLSKLHFTYTCMIGIHKSTCVPVNVQGAAFRGAWACVWACGCSCTSSSHR